MKKFLIPIGVFALLGLLLGYAILQMQQGAYSPRAIPSPLIGKPLPAFALPALADPARTITPDSMRGKVYLLNVWASWCAGCRDEHALLLALAREKGVPIVGLNHKDKRDDALMWLKQWQDPYIVNIADADGRYSIELGVYGVPETFVVDREGIIRYRHVGPITPAALTNVLLPQVAALTAPTNAPR